VDGTQCVLRQPEHHAVLGGHALQLLLQRAQLACGAQSRLGEEGGGVK
jgi:hypothetical protein